MGRRDPFGVLVKNGPAVVGTLLLPVASPEDDEDELALGCLHCFHCLFVAELIYRQFPKSCVKIPILSGCPSFSFLIAWLYPLVYSCGRPQFTVGMKMTSQSPNEIPWYFLKRSLLWEHSAHHSRIEHTIAEMPPEELVTESVTIEQESCVGCLEPIDTTTMSQ